MDKIETNPTVQKIQQIFHQIKNQQIRSLCFIKIPYVR